MAWESVESSDVKAVEYDEEAQILHVNFIKTGIYTYFKVPMNVYEEFMAAESKGRFVNYWMKQGKWPYTKGYASKE